MLAGECSLADFVTTESGTGLVHQAPAFGEVDYDVLLNEQAVSSRARSRFDLRAVGPDGKFTAEASPYEGRWVKEADRDIIRELRVVSCCLPPRAVPARLSVLLAGGGGSADPVSAGELVRPHDAVQGRRCSPTMPRSIGYPNTSRTGGSEIFSKPTSIGRCRASVIGERRCRSGSASRPARWRRSTATTSCWRNLASGDRSLGTGQSGQPGAAGRSASAQTVHRRRHLRFAILRLGRGCSGCPK